MNDDSIVKIMQALDLDYSKAILSTMQFGQSIEGLNKQLANSKNIAMQSAKDINTAFSSQLGQLAGSKTIVDQFGKPFKTIKDEAKAASANVKSMAKEIKQSNLEQMKAQAASIQQRATTKGLSQEYAKQAGTLREQLSVIQARLQAEGKLSAEEIKQTQQLQEQLKILKAQTGTAISDKIRQDPDWLGEEFQRRTSWFLTGTMFYGIINGAKEAVGAIKDVEMGMVELARVMTDSTFVFEEYRDSLFELGIEYGQTFDNVQQIALRWAQSGYNVADSLELTETSLLALNTAELDAKQATEAMIGIMAQWQLQAEDMALVMDKINITADRHSVTSQDLVDGLLRSSGAARIMNLSLEETIGLLTVMREASGRTGQEVGNALNSILSYIQRPKSIDMLESLGINMFTDAAKTKFRNVLDIFKDIASNWNTLSKEIQDGFVQSADDADLFNEELATALGMQEEWNDLQQRDISQAAAGVYRRNYFIGMIERLANVQGVLNNMMDAEGYSMRENAQTMESLEKKQQSLKASMEALAVAAGDAGLGGSLKALANGGTDALNAINKMPKGMKDLVMATTSTFLAIKALELGMKTFGIQLPGISLSIKDLKGSIASLTAALKAGGTGLATFAKANAPLLVLSASIGIIIAARNAIKKDREEREKAIEVSKEHIETLEKQKQGLTELASEYETLKAKEKNLTATADEKERLLEIQRELVDTYEVSISGINAEGQAYADSTEAIRERIKALEEEKAAEMERLETAVMAKDIDDMKQLQKELDELDRLSAKLVEIDERIKAFKESFAKGETLNIGGMQVTSQHKDYEKRAEAFIQSLYGEKEKIQNAMEDVNIAISDLTADRERLLKEDATRTVQQLSKNGVAISDATRLFATQFADALSMEKDIEKAKTTLENGIKDFAGLMQDFDRAIAEGDTQGLEKSKNAIISFVDELIKAYPQLEIVGTAIKEYIANPSESAADAISKLETAIQNLNAEFNKAYEEATEKLQDYYVFLDELNSKKGLSAESQDKIIRKYQELLPYLADEEALHRRLIEVIANEEKTQYQAYINKLMYSKEFYNAKIKGNAELLEKLNEYYQVDFKRYTSLAQAKGKVEAELISQLSGMWAKYYGAIQRGNTQVTAMLEDQVMKRRGDWQSAAEVLSTVHKVGNLENEFEKLALELGGIDFKGINTSKIKEPKTKKGKKDQRQFLDSIDAEIRAIQSKNDHLEKTSDLLQDQLKLAKDIEGVEGLAEQYRITGKIIEHNKELLQSYKDEQDEIHQKANEIREQYSKYNIDSWFDSNAEQTVAYINQYNKATKDQQNEMQNVFNWVQKLKRAWMDANSEVKNVLKTNKELTKELESQPDKVRSIVKELIEAEKRNAYHDLELRQRRANERLRTARQEMEDDVAYYQSKIDRIQDEIDRIQESERARQERLERSKRLTEISKLQNRYYTLQYKNLANLTEEQAKSLGLEKERERYLERQAKIQELLIKLENIRSQKKIKQYAEQDDGTWDFVHVADQKEIDDINKQIEDLQKEHSESLTDLKEKTLEDLKKAQEDYDEWERQNDIRRQIERKQQRIKEYQDDIQDLQNKFAEKERRTNEAFAREKENLDRFYTDIDLLTDEKMGELEETFGKNWKGIYSTLTGYFDDIKREYRSLIDELSQPMSLPDGGDNFYEPSGRNGSGSNSGGSYKPNVTAVRMTTPDGRSSSVSADYVDEYLKKGYKLGWKSDEKHEGGIVGDGTRDLPEFANRLFNTKADERMLKGKIGELFVPEENLAKYFIPNMKKLVAQTIASIPNLLENIQTTQNLITNINIPSLNKNSATQPTMAQSQSTAPPQIIHNHIDKIEFPDVRVAKEIEQAILNLPRMIIQNG